MRKILWSTFLVLAVVALAGLPILRQISGADLRRG